MAVLFNGKKLKQLRNEQKVSQYQLGDACDINARYIRSLESGKKKNPSAVIVYSVSKALGVSMEELMEVEGEPE